MAAGITNHNATAPTAVRPPTVRLDGFQFGNIILTPNKAGTTIAAETAKRPATKITQPRTAVTTDAPGD